jgi:hypothetical protein
MLNLLIRGNPPEVDLRPRQALNLVYGFFTTPTFFGEEALFSDKGSCIGITLPFIAASSGQAF